jgi:hypothetical protein
MHNVQKVKNSYKSRREMVREWVQVKEKRHQHTKTCTVPYIEGYSHATNTFNRSLSNPLTPTFCGQIIRLLITCQHVLFSSPLLAPAVLWCLQKYEPILCLYFTCPIKYLTENYS